jgi:NADH:ubiquinone oxidoreductase subunit 2 (subunit N)
MMDKIYPFYSSAVLLAAAFISVFFGLSRKKPVKIFIIIIFFLAITYAFFLNVRTFIAGEVFSNYLFNFSYLQMVEISIILFISLNILIFISINNIGKDNFIKILIIFIFTVFCASLYIMSSNFLMIFTSLVIFIACIFQLVTLLNSDNYLIMVTEYSIRNHLIRYFLVSVFSLLLILVGFSLIFGSTNFKNFAQVLESGKIDSAMLKAGIFIIFTSIYVYLFIFPLQSAYIKLIKRCEQTSVLVIWFLYFPAGIFLFLKLKSILFYFIEKNNFYLTIAFLAVAFLLAFCGNIGAVKTTSLRRILTFLFLSSLGVAVLAIANYSLGFIDDRRVDWLIFSNLAVTGLCYLPMFAVFSEVEKIYGSDSIENIRGFARTNKFVGVNLIILLLSFGGLIGTCGYLLRFYFIKPLIDYFRNVTWGQRDFNSFILIVCAAFIAAVAFVFLAANIIRIIVIVLRKSESKRVNIAKFYFVYITFYTVLILSLGIIGLFEILNIDIGFITFKITSLF